jgi:hypothetical protein
MMTTEPCTVQDWLPIVEGEYLEMPGLALTKPQVQRLWRLDPRTCDLVLDALMASEFLEKTPRDSYVLARRSISHH